jgi:hypothetical protein
MIFAFRLAIPVFRCHSEPARSGGEEPACSSISLFLKFSGKESRSNPKENLPPFPIREQSRVARALLPATADSTPNAVKQENREGHGFSRADSAPEKYLWL